MIAINKNASFDQIPDTAPQFRPGKLVRHVRYGYRAVVVAVDGHCKADPEWYMSNKTQPPRSQPWYHLLVHACESCTYAAQSSLAEDFDLEPIRHPLLEYFFEGRGDGGYIRNHRPWPDCSGT